MDLEGIILSEICQTEKDMYSMLSIICRIEKIKQINVYNKPETFTDIENNLVITSGEREGGRGKIGVWD